MLWKQVFGFLKAEATMADLLYSGTRAHYNTHLIMVMIMNIIMYVPLKLRGGADHDVSV